MIDSDTRRLLKRVGDGEDEFFDFPWIEEAHGLLMCLLNSRASRPRAQWEDLRKLFELAHRAKHVELCDDALPSAPDQEFLNTWKRYRELTRRLAKAKSYADITRVARDYPNLAERATESPRVKAVRGEFCELQDVIWIALYMGQMIEIDYRQCEADNCERFAAVTWSWPKREGRQPRYCDRHDPKTRDALRQKRKRDEVHEHCREVVRAALLSLPEKERWWSTEPERRTLAARLYKLSRKEVNKFPGHTANWIGREINRGGKLNAYKQI